MTFKPEDLPSACTDDHEELVGYGISSRNFRLLHLRIIAPILPDRFRLLVKWAYLFERICYL